jgi:hypothetical protein
MSFDEFEDCFVWRCDRCGKSTQFPPDDFWGALRELKVRGWQFERDEEGWGHTCGNCARKFAREILDRPVVRMPRR